MADAVGTQILIDGDRNAVMKFTNLSDGTGEAAVTKVDVSALQNAPAEVAIEKIHYSVFGMVLSLFWDADTDVKICDLQGDGCLDLNDFGGLPNNAGTGKTGDIKFTTTGHTAGDCYTVILEMRKKRE